MTIRWESVNLILTGMRFGNLNCRKRHVGEVGHSKLESTVRYLGIEVDDALEMAEQTEI